ncbi:hypothetical protein L0U85_03615 [Glycomyces sp. L485]|uniref:hypothetical protein n=1 Tax=Glycomyces sp. L485 TaxID=2909235 RepID=UPI001F4A51E6|nr:hypothetical protein [Glycomyces sp. L485]MCH7229950.1 hypothetical protein [Glycomyces sp. L485]
MPPNHDETEELELQLDPASLQPWARFSAIGLGVVLAGIGCWAVLAESGNQAGTVGIFLMGIVLLVMGLQDTPLTGITAGGGANFVTRRQFAVAKDLVEDRLGEGEPDEAQAVLDTVRALNPRLDSSPAFKGLYYEALVATAFDRIGRPVRREHPDIGPDFVLVGSLGQEFAVELKASGRTFTAVDVMRIRDKVRSMYHSDKYAGLLVVVDHTQRPGAQEVLKSKLGGFPVEIATWQGADWDHELANAVDRLLSSNETA